MTAVLTIAGYGLREAMRRKVFVGRAACSRVAFLALYWLGVRYAFNHVDQRLPARRASTRRTFAGAFLFGMAMFGTLFLGVVLAIFLTLGTVRGDAERGLLQPLVVRPDRPFDACSSRGSSARRRSACRTSWSSTSRRWR